MDLTPTASQTAGPYFHLGCTEKHSVPCIAGPNAEGERVRLACRVLDGDGVPVDDAMIEIWQADAEGKYNHPLDRPKKDAQEDAQENDSQEKHWPGRSADATCPGFGRMATDANGVCVFETIKPGRVPGNGGTLQAPHLNVSVFARGIMKRLATRIYFAGDPANDECPILALVPAERRATLMARSTCKSASGSTDSCDPKLWRFDVRLCGEDETVFFDV